MLYYRSVETSFSVYLTLETGSTITYLIVVRVVGHVDQNTGVHDSSRCEISNSDFICPVQ